MMPGSILTAPLHRPVGPSFAIGGTRRRGALEFVVSTMSLRPGSTLGPYAIRAELGHGGMGIVYTAHDPRLKRQVAGMSRALLKLSGSLVHDYATIADDSPSPNRASRARRAATSAGIS